MKTISAGHFPSVPCDPLGEGGGPLQAGGEGGGQVQLQALAAGSVD